MAKKFFLGIDIGTYESKGVIIDAAGRVVTCQASPHEMESPGPGYAEHDAEKTWWADFCTLSRGLLEQSGVEPQEIKAVGCSTIAPCCLPVDRAGDPLRKAILYGVDVRAHEEIRYLEDKLGKEYILQRYGTPVTSQSAAAKILWIKNHEPDVYKTAARFVTGSTYLVAKLTGRYVIDRYTAAAWVPLLSIGENDWDAAHLDLFCRYGQLAECLWTHEIAGTVTRAAAAETGLAEGTPVSAGTADTAAEAISAGVLEPGDMLLMYGSSIFIIHVTTKPFPDSRIWTGPYLFPNTYVVSAGMSTAGTLTRWFRDQMAKDLLEKQEQTDRNAYALMAEEASQIPPGSDGLIVLPYFSGERTPINDPLTKGMIFGLNLNHSRAHVYQACLEGVGYGIAQHFDIFDELQLGTKKVMAVGGGVKNQKWLQIVSDISGKTQHTVVEGIGAAYGDALLAALGTSHYRSVDEFRRIIRLDGRSSPTTKTTRCIYHKKKNTVRFIWRQETSCIHDYMNAYMKEEDITMISILIVDDETNTLDCLQGYVPWAELGVSTIETARNGIAALEIAHRMQPDILLCDIKMPKMDGIKLATKVRGIFPDCIIIFLSGYSEKEYLKSALHLKAIDYIDKPINYDKLALTIKNAVALIIENINNKTASDLIKKAYHESIPLLRQEIVLKLVQGAFDQTTSTYKYEDPFLNTKILFASVITVKIKWDVRFDQKAIIASISKIAEYFNDDKLFDPAYIIIGFSSSDHIIMIIKEHFDTLTSTLNNPFIIKLRAYFNDFGGIPISVSIGIGPTENNMTNLPSSYHLSCKANQLRFYLGMGEVFYYKDAISSNLLVDSNIYTDFENAIKSDDKYEAFAIIMKVFNSARNATCDDVNYIKNVFFTIIITFFRIAGEKKLIDENLNSHKEYIWDQIYKIETITELLDYTLSFHKSYFLRIEVKYSTQSKNVHVVIKYIRNNFCSPDISIKSISEHTFLSQGYLCSIFKKEQGKTINEFITELRIEKAKELMQNKVLRLYEIASHIGFQNVNYFSMVFRRYTGCSPSEYRSKWLI